MTKTNFIFFFLCLRVLVAELLKKFKTSKIFSFPPFHFDRMCQTRVIKTYVKI